MRVRNGLPTKKAIFEAADELGIILNADILIYGDVMSASYGREYQNDQGEKLAEMIRSAGFEVNFHPASAARVENGRIYVFKKGADHG